MTVPSSRSLTQSSEESSHEPPPVALASLVPPLESQFIPISNQPAMLRLHEPSANMAFHPGFEDPKQPVPSHPRCYAWHLDRHVGSSFPLQYILSDCVAESIDRRDDADVCRLMLLAHVAGTKLHYGCRNVY